MVTAFFGGTKERNPDVCIWVCRKSHDSNTWTAPIKAADGVFDLDDPDATIAGVTADIKNHRKACWNPVLFQVPGGDLLIFFKIGLNVPDWTGWLVRSKDGGKTWSKREPLPKGFLGPIKNKPEFINRRIICPSSTEGNAGWRIHMEYSDDMGKTWKTTGPIDAEQEFLSQHQGIGADDSLKRPIQVIQPSILKHKDGTLQVICRTRNSHLATSWSKDNGTTWSKVTLIDELPNNNSGTDAVTLKDGRHVLVYNNSKPQLRAKKAVRTHSHITRVTTHPILSVLTHTHTHCTHQVISSSSLATHSHHLCYHAHSSPRSLSPHFSECSHPSLVFSHSPSHIECHHTHSHILLTCVTTLSDLTSLVF